MTVRPQRICLVGQADTTQLGMGPPGKALTSLFIISHVFFVIESNSKTLTQLWKHNLPWSCRWLTPGVGRPRFPTVSLPLATVNWN